MVLVKRIESFKDIWNLETTVTLTSSCDDGPVHGKQRPNDGDVMTTQAT